MSLKKWVRIAIGILASSGVAVVLSGGALAANNGQDTTSQNVRIQPSTGTAPQATGDSTVSNYFRQTQNDANGQQSVTQESGSNGGAEGGAGTDPTQAGSSNQAVTVQQGGDDANTNGTQATNSSNAKPSQKALNAGTGNGNDVNSGRGGAVVSSSTSDNGAIGAAYGSGGTVSAESVSEVAVVTPVTALPEPAGVKPSTRTTILQIQPVITNRSAALTPDLAETMPSAPTPARAPVPAKSSGVLAGLVVGLSNVVVPHPVTPTEAVWFKLMIAVGGLTLVVLLANVFEFSYGQWLRRGGFATAARSDEPLDSLTPLFATPLFSGYVEQPPRLHSPILMVLVPNAYRKEDRR